MASSNLCWCGSRKKLKNCHKVQRQPREQSLTLDFGMPVTVDRVELDPATGITRFYGPEARELVPERAWFSSHYKRRDGKRALGFEIDVAPTGALPATLGTVLSRFNRFYLVDTSWTPGPSGTHAVATVFAGRHAQLFTGFSSIHFHMAGHLEFAGVRVPNPERLAWLALIDLVRRARDYDLRWTIGLFTDSEQGQHQLLNRRVEPIFKRMYLPSTFQLLYAKDQGSDSAMNSVMGTADHTSREMIQGLTKRPPPSVLLRQPPDPDCCDWYRLWAMVNDRQCQVVPPEYDVDSLLRPVGRRSAGRPSLIHTP